MATIKVKGYTRKDGRKVKGYSYTRKAASSIRRKKPKMNYGGESVSSGQKKRRKPRQKRWSTKTRPGKANQRKRR